MDEPVGGLFQNDYSQIVAMARARLAKERSPISTLTLVHELYLDLNERDSLQFPTREHFLAYASRAMRSLLVDMARERIAKKRTAQLLPLTLGAEVAGAAGTPEQLVALDGILERLGHIDERLARVAEMRLLLGVDTAAIAVALGVSEPTVKRDWQRTRAYLQEALGNLPPATQPK
jgi:RNA polymerase sigma factor (TIGR02999 family)